MTHAQLIFALAIVIPLVVLLLGGLARGLVASVITLEVWFVGIESGLAAFAECINFVRELFATPPTFDHLNAEQSQAKVQHLIDQTIVAFFFAIICIVVVFLVAYVQKHVGTKCAQIRDPKVKRKLERRWLLGFSNILGTGVLIGVLLQLKH